jgi:FtsZ-binding cell division protein ZapB
MSNKEYPLHPGQTQASPDYIQIPQSEYEALKKENKHLQALFDSVKPQNSDVEIDTLASECRALREMNAKAQEKIAVLNKCLRWRKTSEELPKTRILVLTISNEGCYDLLALMERENGTKYWDAFDDEGHEYEFKEISYWQPLPKDPEEK